jgi:hypothetical protein
MKREVSAGHHGRITESSENRVNRVRVYRCINGSVCSEKFVSSQLCLPTKVVGHALIWLVLHGHVYFDYLKGVKLYRKASRESGVQKTPRIPLFFSSLDT